MRYRLKNREFQHRLDNISNGEFSERLDAAVKANRPRGGLFYVTFGDPVTPDLNEGRITLRFHYTEIEGDIQYNPNAWNPYPDVLPPKDVLMRVECNNGARRCAKFRLNEVGSDGWVRGNGRVWIDSDTVHVVRYRPWDEEEARK